MYRVSQELSRRHVRFCKNGKKGFNYIGQEQEESGVAEWGGLDGQPARMSAVWAHSLRPPALGISSPTIAPF